MKQHIGAVCILLFTFLAGAIISAALLEKKAVFVQATTIPPVVVVGADSTYTVGDIVTLSIKPPALPANTKQLHYDWKVIDQNQPNKNIIKSKDNTTINFGTGSKPTKITVLVVASAVLGTTDTNGNVQDINLQTSGITSFDINVK